MTLSGQGEVCAKLTFQWVREAAIVHRASAAMQQRAFERITEERPNEYVKALPRACGIHYVRLHQVTALARHINMKLSATDKHFEISVSRTPEDLQKAIRALVEEHAKLSNNFAADSKEPLIGGNGRIDVRIIDSAVQVGLACSFGWVLTRFDAASSCGMASRISSCAQQLLLAGAAQTEISTGKISLH